jgi:protein SCO1/2
MMPVVKSSKSPNHHKWNVSRAILVVLFVIAAQMHFPANSAPFSFYSTPYSFTNDRGQTVHLSEWRGKPLILTMEYSNCRFMCTTTFSKMKAIQEAADQKKLQIDFMIVSLDPNNDTPQAWRQYRISREVDRNNWHLLTGSEDTTKKFASLVGIKYWQVDDHILHDFKIVRLNAEGEIEKSIVDFDDEPDSLLQ